ncbi:sensor domain-containing diguanylate cyclase [Planococcus shenhongbingii]|uniref:Sensor domain-containing diguanylate cyclase n=1 Tax=Planococcus shenhongbingii TaxID=3058398 RepID=A0ABT8NDC6_9BACL|nr:sensor domain-containing diguanylate cyclase [Planococcus sp. N017]MDN7245891.1 sensor domain-containing diguanylate cyclase [Planococcus sp. N017]
MGELSKRTMALWALWLLLVPPGLFLVYQTFPPPEIDPWHLTAYVLFFVITCLMPMNINGASTYLVQWVTIAVFLKYGIFVEILISQLTMLIVLTRSRTDEPLSMRIPFNSTMFFLISCCSGLAYLAAGGQIGSLNLVHIIFYGLLFQIVSVIANQIIYYSYDRITGSKAKFFSVDAMWDFALTLLVFPYAIALYISEAYIGIPALLLLGIPFLIMTAVMKMYNNSEQITSDLKKAGEIGHQLAERLSTDEVLDQFVIQVSEMFKSDYAYVIDYRDGNLLMLRMYENQEFEKFSVPPVRYHKGIAGNVIVTNTPVIYRKKSEWKDIVTGYIPIDTESIMCTPIARNNKIEGVLLLASRKKYAFVSHQLKILDILSTYFAVSLEKAGYVQKAIAKSERCGLTKLYNYRYLDEALEKSMGKVNTGRIKNLSLVMMDIDHFKGINDKYGHQSGNDILIELARILEAEVGREGIVARYGGEEFVIMFENYSKDLALLFAESLRRKIEKHKFSIQRDLDTERSTENVHITLSIGVSTAPDDSDEPNALIRNADRALYIGAKQAGRNKVAAYVK